ncbi:MAG: hypothetical protein J07HQW2_01060 [Haloquadratum walsbyi J07HQW2]|uniref:Uncharacterized protein n=1 Tax=Haloquadratum walsbyi J07HQW2 TaxID=1238425 RepID=U1MW22_9EURY|nr:MAG: hypothetical protein J07HQW2_01060 [Haloquadratum walsbyi J07HQW2]
MSIDRHEIEAYEVIDGEVKPQVTALTSSFPSGGVAQM